MRPPEHPPGWKSGTYAMQYQCHNCKRRVMVVLKKGQKAPEKAGLSCPNCGCTSLWKK